MEQKYLFNWKSFTLSQQTHNNITKSTTRLFSGRMYEVRGLGRSQLAAANLIILFSCCELKFIRSNIHTELNLVCFVRDRMLWTHMKNSKQKRSLIKPIIVSWLSRVESLVHPSLLNLTLSHPHTHYSNTNCNFTVEMACQTEMRIQDYGMWKFTNKLHSCEAKWTLSHSSSAKRQRQTSYRAEHTLDTRHREVLAVVEGRSKSFFIQNSTTNEICQNEADNFGVCKKEKERNWVLKASTHVTFLVSLHLFIFPSLVECRVHCFNFFVLFLSSSAFFFLIWPVDSLSWLRCLPSSSFSEHFRICT